MNTISNPGASYASYASYTTAAPTAPPFSSETDGAIIGMAGALLMAALLAFCFVKIDACLTHTHNMEREPGSELNEKVRLNPVQQLRSVRLLIMCITSSWLDAQVAGLVTPQAAVVPTDGTETKMKPRRSNPGIPVMNRATARSFREAISTRRAQQPRIVGLLPAHALEYYLINQQYQKLLGHVTWDSRDQGVDRTVVSNCCCSSKLLHCYTVLRCTARACGRFERLRCACTPLVALLQSAAAFGSRYCSSYSAGSCAAEAGGVSC
jgi:hypothetical protein